MKVRQLLTTAHLCIGLTLAPVLAVVGITGAILVFQPEVEDAVNARYTRVAPAGSPLALAELVAAVKRTASGATVDAIDLPARADRAAVITASGPAPAAWLVDPYTGRVTGRADHLWTMRPVALLHRRLLAGETGATVVTLAAVGLLFLSITGLILWWPGRIFRFSRSATGWRLAFNVHNALGAWAWGGFLLLGATGVIIHWDKPAAAAIARVTGTPPRPRPRRGAAGCAPDAMPGPDALLASARRAEPGARVTRLALGDADGSPARAILRYPEDHTPAGRTQVLLDACTGGILSAISSRTAGLDYRIVNLWNRQVHTGDLFGWPTRILAAVLALTLPLVSATGPLLWWLRRRQRTMNESAVRPGRRASVAAAIALLAFAAPHRLPAQDSAAGRLEMQTITSRLLGEDRRVWIYTPPGYDSTAARQYPLVLTFDGAGYVAMMKFPDLLDSLRQAGRLPPFIAVMVDDSANRLGDLANHAKFIDFLGDELIPWLRAHYRVTTDPRRTIVTGVSAGGLAAAYAAFRRPDLFGNVLSQSGAFWRPNEGSNDPPDEWLVDQYAEAPRKEVRFFLEMGALERQYPHARSVLRMRDVLRAKGYAVTWIEVPDAAHEPTHWRRLMPAGLIDLAGNWS